MAAFTVSVLTIDGVANSLLVTNSSNDGGNLSELQTALASYGATWTTPRKLSIVGNGTSRIIAINGLKESRNGNWEVDISGEYHVCWAYNNGGLVDQVWLGSAPTSAGIYKSFVHISEVMPLGYTDAYNAARGKCVIGLGAYKHYAGSIHYSGATSATPPFDIWEATTGYGEIYFDNVVISGSRNHLMTRPGIVTTSKTYATFWNRGAVIEVGASVTTLSPITTNNGGTDSGGAVRLAAGAASVLRVLQPAFDVFGMFNCNSLSRSDIVDAQNTYMQNLWANGQSGSVRMLRTVKVTHKDAVLQSAIPESKVVWQNGATVTASTFSSAHSVELQQSEAVTGANFQASGSGWLDYINNPYPFWVLAYGYPSIARTIDIKTEHQGISGVLFAATNSKSPAVSVEYSGVTTAPFAFDTNGNGTLTVVSNATTQAATNYLYKHAFDNATSAFWRTRSHAPVSVVSGMLEFGSIAITGAEFLEGALRGSNLCTTNAGLRSGFIGGPGLIVVQNTATDLTGVQIMGTLSVIENDKRTVTYTDSVVWVENTGTGVLTVRCIDSKVSSAGNASKLYIYTPTFVDIKLGGGRILITDNKGVEQYNTATDSVIELPASATGSWQYRIAKYGQQLITGSFAVDAAKGGTVAIAPSYTTDAQVVDSLAGVQAYSVLDHVQKIYDYASYWRTTAVGLAANPELTLIAGVISTARSIAFQPGASVLLSTDGSNYAVKASSISGTGITSAGTVTLNGCTHNTPLIINDSTGGTRNITGVAGCYVLIRDIFGNGYTTPRPISLATTDLNFRTVNGHSYMIHVDAIGRVPYNVNVQSISGTTAVDLAYDRALIPFGSTLTSDALRVQADRDLTVTGYTCTEAGVMELPNGGSLAEAYLYARRLDEQRLTKGAPYYNGTDMITRGNASMLGDGVLIGTGSMRVQGQWTGRIGTVNIEDDDGVRVRVVKSELALFNIAARVQTASGYTDLPYQSGVEEAVYAIPRGQALEIVMWSFGHVTYSRTIQTTDGGSTFAAEMTLNKSIDLALDVSTYMANITLSLDSAGAYPVFVITFNAPMTVSGIELGKAIVHRLVGSETALRSGFPPGSTATIVINADEITNQLPAVRLEVGAAVPVTGRVYLDFFFNTTAARAINPAYSINPPRADGNQVNILRAKPVLDASVLAAGVWESPQRTLTSGGGSGGTTSRPSIEF